MTRPDAVSDLRQRAELARALLVGSAWCERCKPLAWQVGMALAGKTWAAISRGAAAATDLRRGDQMTAYDRTHHVGDDCPGGHDGPAPDPDREVPHDDEHDHDDNVPWPAQTVVHLPVGDVR